MSKMKAPDILVWTASQDAVPESHWGSLSELLDAAELKRAARFVFERHRRQYIAAHALTRLMLASVAGEPPWSWAFEIAAGGKPFVTKPGLWFNITHSERLVACAVSQSCKLGVDVEPITGVVLPVVADAYLAGPERRWIDNLPVSDRGIGFLRLWTLKEAFIKATGRGLAQPLQAFSFEFEPIRVTFHDAALGDSRAWRFEQWEVGGHILALAWHHASSNLSADMQETRLDALVTRALERAG